MKLVKRILSVMMSISLLLSSVSFYASAVSITEEEDINIYNTVIKVPGLTETYKFLQVSDTHVAVIPEDTSRFDYSHAVSRNAHFGSYTEGDYLEMLDKYYAYAEKEGVDAVLLTGDIIDFPSEENVDFLYDVIDSSPLTTMYTVGNHDWSYPDASFGYGAYLSQTQRETFLPLFNRASVVESCGNTDNPHGSYIDFGELVVVMLNDSDDMFTYTQSYNVLKNALALNKPTIVCYHSPLYSPTLTEDIVAQWKTNQIVGSHRGASMWTIKTSTIVSMLESSENIIGLFAGHAHFEHEDVVYDSSFDMSKVVPNNVIQYLCPSGYDGNCRLITITGDDSTCNHSYETEVLYKANCNVRGVDMLTCTKCDDVKKQIVDHTTHEYTQSVVIDATCKATGIMKHTCIHCNDSYNEDIPLKEHNYVLKTVLTKPTYISTGVGMYVCSGCADTKYLSIPMLVLRAGDVDLDGTLTAKDLLLMIKYILGAEELDSNAVKAADINSDGRVGAKDYKSLKFTLANNID